MKFRRTMKAQSPKKKKKKKEIIIIIIIIKKKEEDLGQARGHAARISVRPKDMQQGSRSEDMQQEEHQGPRTLICLFEALRRGP